MDRVNFLAWGAWAMAGIVLAGSLRGDELGQRASWTSPTASEVKAEIDKWLEGRELDELTREKIDALWPAEGAPAAGTETLEQLAATIAAVDEAAAPLVALCHSQRRPVMLPEFPLLNDADTPPLVRNNLHLLYGRWLAQHHLYDEAREQLGSLEPADVVDPASLLFYQGVVYHRLLDKDNCLPAIAKLLENADTIPRRYSAVARLMEADLQPLEADTLDEIARLMDDIRRRLELGRAGTKVRQQEDEVIAKLDKMIEELEEQQQQQQGGGGNAGGAQSSSPAQDSANLGGRGDGDVDPKNIGKTAGWGNLPPKERQEALQQLSKELPAHYREVIEEYFRKLAREGGE